MGVTYTTSSAPTYTQIATYTFPSTLGIYTFSSIPQTYTDLVVVISANCAAAGTTYANLQMNLNGDSANNYSYCHMYGDGSSAYSDRYSNNGQAWGGYFNSTSGVYSNIILNVMNYSNTSTYKNIISRGNYGTRGTTTTNPTELAVSSWRNTAAVTSLTIGGANIGAGSTFTLYGILAA
jgi:hypothetical protein